MYNHEDATGSINLMCNQVLCLNEPVQHECTVTDSILLRWRVRNNEAVSIGTETYATGDIISSTTPLTNAPDFSTDLSSSNPSIISNISFIVQSNINGYSVHCEASGGDSKNCTIIKAGEFD